ncbi:superfamily II DNA/RNA helicase [Chitinivorax tropicus]|uniref:DEAD-box ATP-dependent RNA helicase RhpA n=1 Tax=Chitinivorax tropicus TaxID=714531 RepID=A0A840MK77_9PROT|nr:DEAD/DEAH box helicase [Chitinivorax tropicus]MBB5017905.1 superfamily II DNA/RNA helicase [Chitinivorax tropicus]
MSFADLGLSPELLRAVAEQGYSEPTPIQAQAIPVVLGGRDVLAAAQTGTGKTAGFTLPILHLLQPAANSSPSPARHPLRALILTPTRELADQVGDSVKGYAKYVPLRSTVAFGGVNIDSQIPALRAGVEVLVATPGRLLDHVQQKTVVLNRVDILVLDEADRMLDMGFLPDIRRILSMLPAERQTLLFSATFSPEIKKLADQFLRNPQVIEVARRNSTNEQVTQVVHQVDGFRKRATLAHLIRHHDMQQVIVFCNTRQGAERLSRELAREGFAADAIHGDKTQQQRLETLAQFKEGKVKVLVATDVAARGLDIEELPYVVNHDLPNTPEDYVHRIGRTGRAGAKGTAISLVSDEESKQLAAIEKLVKQSLELVPVPGYTTPRTPQAAPTATGAALMSNGRTPAPVRPLYPGRGPRQTEQVAALFLPPRYRRS